MPTRSFCQRADHLSTFLCNPQCIDGFSAKLGDRRSVAEPGGQLGVTIVSGAGGRYPRLLCGRTAL